MPKLYEQDDVASADSDERFHKDMADSHWEDSQWHLEKNDDENLPKNVRVAHKKAFFSSLEAWASHSNAADHFKKGDIESARTFAKIAEQNSRDAYKLIRHYKKEGIFKPKHDELKEGKFIVETSNFQHQQRTKMFHNIMSDEHLEDSQWHKKKFQDTSLPEHVRKAHKAVYGMSLEAMSAHIRARDAVGDYKKEGHFFNYAMQMSKDTQDRIKKYFRNGTFKPRHEPELRKEGKFILGEKRKMLYEDRERNPQKYLRQLRLYGNASGIAHAYGFHGLRDHYARLAARYNEGDYFNVVMNYHKSGGNFGEYLAAKGDRDNAEKKLDDTHNDMEDHVRNNKLNLIHKSIMRQASKNAPGARYDSIKEELLYERHLKRKKKLNKLVKFGGNDNVNRYSNVGSSRGISGDLA